MVTKLELTTNEFGSCHGSFVLPTGKMNGTFNTSSTPELIYQFWYDHKNRIIQKKVPGAKEVYMVYDARDRLVMMQDANLKVALKNFQDTDFHIVLNHCPEYRDFMLSQRRDFPWMDLVLAGHTHGGQINMLGFIPVLPPGSGRYLKGWYRETYPHMYVSRGIGMSVFPVRFGSRPEISTFHLNV